MPGRGWKIGLAFFLLGAHACAGTSAWASAPHQDVHHPAAFPGADVNVVFVPFTFTPTGFARANLGPGAEALALAMQLQTMISLAPLERYGTIQLDAAGTNPTPEWIFQALMGKGSGAARQVAPGGGLIELWGVVSEDEGDVSIQTFLRFGRRGEKESRRVGLGDSVAFALSPSSQFLSFDGRTVATSELASIRKAGSGAMRVHTEMNESSPWYSLFVPGRATPVYSVLEVKAPWIRVQPAGMPSGWIHLESLVGARPLPELLPELEMVRLVAAYLRDRSDEAHGDPPSRTLMSEAQQALDAFRVGSSDDEDSRALAVGEQLVALMYYRRSTRAHPDLVLRAAALFDSAATRLGFNAVAQSDAAMCDLQAAAWQAASGARVDGRALQTRLARAAALDPSDDHPLDNLESFYHFAGTGAARSAFSEGRGFTDAEIQTELNSLSRVRGKPPGGAIFVRGGGGKSVVHGESIAIDINTASKRELMMLAGIGDATAEKIIAGRPYTSKAQLESKGIVTKAQYAKIRAHVLANEPAPAPR